MLSGTVLSLFLAAFSFCSIPYPVMAAGSVTVPDVAALRSTQSVRQVPPPPGKVILILIDALDVESFISPEWFHLRRLTSNGVIGLMNSRTASTPMSTVSAAAHVTLGAGARAPGGTSAGHGADVDDTVFGIPAGLVYESTSGFLPPPSGVVVLGLPQLAAAAAVQKEGARPGALGTGVAALGGRVAVIGNADVPDPDAFRTATKNTPSFISRRHAALVAMDDRGQIPLGSVGSNALIFDETWPFAWRTDYDGIWDTLIDLYEDASFIVVELGDFARLDGFADRIQPERLVDLRRETIRRMDEWFGRLELWSPRVAATIVVITPSPPGPELRNNFLLTPFASFTIHPQGPGGTNRPRSLSFEPENVPRLATAPTTRRAGIVANVDVAPFVLTALHFLDGADFDTLGPIHAATKNQLSRDIPPGIRPPKDGWERIGWLYERITETHRLRPPVVQAFITSAIVLFALWAAWMIYVRVAPSPIIRPALFLWRIPLLLLSGTPLAMLGLPLLPVSVNFAGAQRAFPAGFGLVAMIGLIAAGSHGVQRLLDKEKSSPKPRSYGETNLAVVLVSLATALAIVADVWTGSSFMKGSVLGYDPILGARYYGIGNEYMGVLVGTTLIGTTGWLDRLGNKKPSPKTLAVLGLVYTFVCATVAAPTLGANVGGTVAAVVGCGVTFGLLFKGRLTGKTVIFIGLLVGLFITGAALLDMATSGPTSHLGTTVQLVRQEGRQPLFTIAGRKLAMNAKLLRWTIWAQVFVVSLAVSALALARPSKTIRRLEGHHPHLLHGIRGAVVAALVALVANDSGVVAAATMMIPVTSALMYAIILGLDMGDQVEPGR